MIRRCGLSSSYHGGDVRMVVKLSRISKGRQISYLTKPFTLQKGDKGLKTVTVREAQDTTLDKSRRDQPLLRV